MAKAPNPNDVLRLGQQVATIKANMPRKRWQKFVKVAHSRGHTIAGEISDVPSALKERTAASLRSEAQKTINAAYAPAAKALTTREAAIGFLDQKRKTDDAAYRTWLTGETDKLGAQARAADATLASQQSQIATDTQTAIAAARADSLARMSQNHGNVSDPSQSTALDTSAADTAATQHIQAARDQTAAITHIGEDSRTLANASLLAQQAAHEASRQGDTWKALADVATDRNTLATTKAGAYADTLGSLKAANTSVVQANRDSDLAGASLGLKQQTAAQDILNANRKYKLEVKKFNLDTWKADNSNLVDQAKVQLGYDQIKSREGIGAANRKLNIKLAQIRAADKVKAKGVTSDERDLYRNVSTASGLFTRWDKNNAVPLGEREQHLRDMGFDDVTIAAAHDIARNHGTPTAAGRAALRKLGVKHVGYFYAPSKITFNGGSSVTLNDKLP